MLRRIFCFSLSSFFLSEIPHKNLIDFYRNKDMIDNHYHL
ncbi:hypothetical protein PROVRUST_07912 [Providencia rustigianii DSM 4541]|uniref:Uncharacterized protein n=1 Tax=Providencia rustigianii DSM 4541 TaxID=500637 RepID=D1P6I8_9GAMM|nr:hypothetical protein PROVRUST_07912 [Providencia rustigianii DSM 4541]